MGIEANEDKEEKRMSNEEVGTKVQEALDRKAMLDKLNELSSLKGDIEAIKANQDGISDLCKRFPGLCEKIDATEKQVKEMKSQQNSYCDPESKLCFPTKEGLENFLSQQTERIEKKIPQILDGAHDLTSFFQKAANEEPQGRIHKILSERMPTKLKVGLVKYWCGDDEECRIALEKDPDIKITDIGQRKPGLLGT